MYFDTLISEKILKKFCHVSLQLLHKMRIYACKWLTFTMAD